MAPSGSTCKECQMNIQNLATNVHWGDEMKEKTENTLRIYCQNVNGLQLDAEAGDFKDVCLLMDEIQADIGAITEHNLDTMKYHVKSICHLSAQADLKAGAKLSMVSSPSEMIGTYKPGGTMILSTGNVLARLISSGNDEMG
jgi:hypothetical protein